MASTTLFAPQIRSVQPAFIYNTNTSEYQKKILKIYFSISDFNTGLDFNAVDLKIIDPNATSVWASNSMIKETQADPLVCNKAAGRSVRPDNGTDYTITLEYKAFFKPFTINQYYQLQIRLKNKNTGVTSDWSQTSLIRPIADHVIQIEQSGDILSFNKINGKIQYVDSSEIEAIQNYTVYLQDTQGNIKYQSKQIYNTLGTTFATNLHDCFVEDGSYFLSIKYTTINGYSGTSGYNQINIGVNNAIPAGLKKYNISTNSQIGGNSLEFEFSNIDVDINAYPEAKIIIQRTSEEEFFRIWSTLKTFHTNPLQCFKYNDLTVKAETVYRYRFIVNFIENNKTYIIDNFNSSPLEILTTFEDIYLLGTDKQLAIRYNPNISGFKYVTQESITNTLGGKFPIIRINGDTKYRQFTLSGTLSFNGDYLSFNSNGQDSRGVTMNRWIKDDYCSLLFNIQALVNNFSENLAQQINKPSFLEKKFRDIAISFLTDQKPKLFKGMSEDTMIVYLSNVTFTPNKQLSREIWDFSCTVTELAEYNQENLVKYGLTKESNIYTLEYAFKTMKKIENGQLIEYIPIEEAIDNIPILHAFWKQISIEEVL